MRYRMLGRTGLRVSRLAPGAANFGKGWGCGTDAGDAPTLRRYLLLLLAGLTAWPALAQSTAATAPTQHVDVGGDRIAYRSIGNGAPIWKASGGRFL